MRTELPMKHITRVEQGLTAGDSWIPDGTHCFLQAREEELGRPRVERCSLTLLAPVD